MLRFRQLSLSCPHTWLQLPLRPASPHQIQAPGQTHIHFIPEGAADSAKVHICTPCCFYYDSHLSLPPVAHLSSPDSEDARCHDTGSYRKRVERHLFPSSYQRVYMHGWGLRCDLLRCRRGSWPRRYSWITVRRCLYVWALVTSQTSDLYLSRRRWEEIFLPAPDSGLHNASSVTERWLDAFKLQLVLIPTITT